MGIIWGLFFGIILDDIVKIWDMGYSNNNKKKWDKTIISNNDNHIWRNIQLNDHNQIRIIY